MKNVQSFLIILNNNEEFYYLWNLEITWKKNYAFSSLNASILSWKDEYLSNVCNAEHSQCKKLPGTKSSLKAQVLQVLTFPVNKRFQKRFHLHGKSDTNSEVLNWVSMQHLLQIQRSSSELFVIFFSYISI